MLCAAVHLERPNKVSDLTSRVREVVHSFKHAPKMPTLLKRCATDEN